ncbi:MAG: YihY/virulence factor BrkB family protein, partial [Odoribacter sp.]|nr:YihY/virulence factor BrkB family protein [Odoribacter sp.]
RDVLYAGNRWVDNVDVAVRVLRYIAEEYAGGQGGTALSALCKKLRISSSKVRIVVEELVEQKVLVEVKDEDDVSYFPAMDFRRLALSDIIVRLSDMGENRGEEWKTRFVQAIKREFAEDTFA